MSPKIQLVLCNSCVVAKVGPLLVNLCNLFILLIAPKPSVVTPTKTRGSPTPMQRGAMRGGSPMRGSRGGTVIPTRGRGVVQATRGM